MTFNRAVCLLVAVIISTGVYGQADNAVKKDGGRQDPMSQDSKSSLDHPITNQEDLLQNGNYQQYLDNIRQRYDTYMEAGKIEDALELTDHNQEEAAVLQNKANTEYRDLLQYIIKQSVRSRYLVEARDQMDKILASMPVDTYLDSISWAHHLRFKGQVMRYMGDYDQSISYLDSALTIRLSSLDTLSEDVSSIYYDLGVTYVIRGDYQISEKLVNKSKEILLQYYDDDDIKLKKDYNALGLIKQGLGKYDEAISYHEKTIDIKQKSKETTKIDLARSYLNLSNLLLDMGQPHIAYEHLTHILSTLGRDHESDMYIWIHNSLGRALISIDKPKEAIDYLQYALQSNRNKYDLSIDASLNYNIGQAYLKLKEQATAIPYLESAKALFIKDTPDHQEIHNIDLAIANGHLQMDDIKAAKRYATLAHDRISKTMPPRHPAIAPVVNLLAEIGKRQGRYLYARTILQAVDSLDLVSSIDMLETVCLRLEISELEGYNDVEAIIKTGVDLATTATQEHLPTEERYILARSIKRFQALHLAYLAKQAHMDTTALLSIFDKTKNSLLRQSIDAVDDIEFAGIPPSLSRKEVDLAKKIHYLEQSISYQYDAKNSTLAKSNTKALKTLREAYRTIKDSIEQGYPKYYALKFGNKALQWSEISSLLESKTLLVDYIMTENDMWILRLTKDSMRLIHRQVDPALTQEIEHYIGYVSDYDYVKSTGNTDEGIKEFVRSSQMLYQQLLAPVIGLDDSTYRSIIIIPDGQLSLLPFETLIPADATIDNYDYRRLPYLVRDVGIQYGYSLSMLSSQNDNANTYEQHYVGYAPVYTSTDQASDRHQDMPRARASIRKGADLLDGEAYLGAACNREALLSADLDCHVLHLAMHAVVDDYNPMLTRLVLSNDTLDEDKALLTSELYNLSLRNELAVLAACSTGRGIIKEGEGVLSIARALTYAGTRQLLVSLWDVPDVSTAMVIDRFLEVYADRSTARQSLRKAKLDYLSQAPSSRSHPFYWSGFVLSGSSQSSVLTTSNRLLARPGMITCLALSFLAVLWIIYKKVG